MSNEVGSRIRELAERTLLDAAWAQWSVLTTAAIPADRRRAWTIVDPEALVLASLTVGHRERRLDDMVASWAAEAAHLISLHRMRALAAGFPGAVKERLGIFTASATSAGDKRWKRLATGHNAAEYVPRLKGLGELRLLEGPALTMRLRAGFGVNAKADILSLLIGFGGAAADLKVIAAATAYTERAVRTATEEMTLAGFIHEIEGRPSSFYADPRAWANVLQSRRLDGGKRSGEGTLPPWRFWAAVFVFLAQVIDWSFEQERKGWTAYVAGSRARDLLDEHARKLRQAQIVLSPTALAPGENVLGAFEELVREIATWANAGLYGGS
ncbi:MAG TPA: hypothetical protein VGA70_14000 [Longimicrobiales bacterium]|jgi:hypothetical protein